MNGTIYYNNMYHQKLISRPLISDGMCSAEQDKSHPPCVDSERGGTRGGGGWGGMSKPPVYLTFPGPAQFFLPCSLRSMAVLSSRAQERRSREIRARSVRQRAAKPREK